MNVLFIGDIHGSENWKNIANETAKRGRQVVFLGDYVDSFDISPKVQIRNLNALIRFKKQYKDIVTLLIGNHDFAYIHAYNAISGYQMSNALTYKKIFSDNLDLFQIACGFTSYNKDGTFKYTLASHAGLTQSYWNNYVLPLFNNNSNISNILNQKDIKDWEIHEILNLFLYTNKYLWKVGQYRGGLSTSPCPLWCDYNELLQNPYGDINQIFGHTAKQSIHFTHKNDCNYICVDTYGKQLSSIIVDF